MCLDEPHYYDPDTIRWLTAVRSCVKGYAAIRLRKGCVIVRTEQPLGCDRPTVVGDGVLRFILLNERLRPRAVSLQVEPIAGRIQKHPDDLNGTSPCTIAIRTAGYDPRPLPVVGAATRIPRGEHTVRFTTVSAGSETVVVSSENGSCELVFDAIPHSSDDRAPMAPLLSAAIEVLKGIPWLGPLVVSPVQAFVNEVEKTQSSSQLNETLSQITQYQYATLQAVLKRDGTNESPEDIFAIEMLAIGLNSIRTRERGESGGGELLKLQWPFPFSQRVLNSEMIYLFAGNMNTFEHAVGMAGYQLIEHRTGVQQIQTFIESAKADHKLAIAAFRELHQKCPSSVILSTAVASLVEYERRAAKRT